MKLRFRKNSLRLRVNRPEVEMLAAGRELAERVAFAGGATLDYILTPSQGARTGAEFDGKSIRVTAPLGEWARGAEIGFYFDVEPGLKVAVEKDLECVDGPEDEKDPQAFPRDKSASPGHVGPPKP
jgi:hypothetical protein